MHIAPGIYIENTEDKGNGVFTQNDLPAGTVVEISPVIVMSAEERKLLDQTLLHDYIFEWAPEGENQCCVAQGYIAVYNHSDSANCEHFMHYDSNSISIKTMRDIAAGEELTINYNGEWNNKRPVWFETV
ncbi:MAG TPA: SET domain-containing protein [Flavipsychrobacter sp.]